MIRRPPRSTLFPTRRSSDLLLEQGVGRDVLGQKSHARLAMTDGGMRRRQALKRIGQRELLHPRTRSEEHTSELQSRPHLVCRLLLEKKKKKCTGEGIVQTTT